MTNELKQFIASEVSEIASKSSQEKVSNRAGVSAATINHIINGKWSLIANEMWRKVQVKLNLKDNWNTAVITNFKILTDLLTVTQKSSMSIGIAYNAGAGKSETYRNYERNNRSVINVECKNTWSTKSYVKALLQAAGLTSEGTVEDMLQELTSHVMGLENPLFVIDQADKLKDKSFDLFMDMYNDMDGFCGFVISGVLALEKRVLKGVQRDKVGYAEFWSRIGKKFIKLDPLKLQDVEAICTANYLTDPDYIQYLHNTCMDDLRVVKRGVQKYFLVEQAKKSA
jgi:DNA transposition AAA+ family ATPase